MINKMKPIHTMAIQAMITELGPERVSIEHTVLHSEMINTLGIDRITPAIVYPQNKKQVQAIIKIANQYKLVLYPISKGENIGYGEKVSISDNQIVVDLSGMNQIRNFDPELGTVTLEPGVTQQQLYDYLQSQKADFWMDATGAGVNTSIVGNTLEGGFGHTPKGNRRANINNVEIVLGNGEIFNAGSFPGLGPDLSGIFVQSNFGIVTALQIELMPIPENFTSFIIQVPNDAAMEVMIAKIRELRQKYTLLSLIHVANATRSLISTSACPEEYLEQVISCEEAQKLMSHPPLIKAGYWTALGGLYGYNTEVRAMKKVLKAAFHNIAKVIFFNDQKIKLLKNMTAKWPLKNTSLGKYINTSIGYYQEVHGYMKGIPSNQALKHIYWKIENPKDMGLIWFAPTVKANVKDIRKMITLAEETFAPYPFEVPITFTLVTTHQVVGILSISFNKNDARQKQLAYQLYNDLKKNYSLAGIATYRSTVFGMDKLEYEPNKSKVLQQLKKELDPNGIISPGRYGIH